MNLPNILTMLRFIMIPVFAYYLYIEQFTAAAAFFILGGLTDFLDGYIARKYDMITDWGKVADPLADKLMTITALVILTFVNKMIPFPLLLIVVLKEAFMVIGGILLYKQENFVVSANWYGKMATVIFYFAIIMIILDVPAPYLPNNSIFIIIAVIATLFAFFMYVKSFKKIKKDSGKV